MSDKFQDKYRIPSARADWWNYGWNSAYFVTICTAHREHYFGEIGANPVMQLSEIGKLAENFWWSIPEHFPFAKLDVFVVMPNHIHGILVIDKLDDGRDINIETGRNVETGHRPVSIDIGTTQTGQCPVSTNPETNFCNFTTEPQTLGKLRFRNQGKHTLSSIIGSYKSIVTKRAHLIHADFAWQERFHDHIICDAEEFCKIANYIENNVDNWHDDLLYS